MSGSVTLNSSKEIFYSLAIGANWGENLTPLGDNILVVNLAEQNKRPISFKQFFKLGFITTIYQLSIISLYYTIKFHFLIGIIIVVSIIAFVLLLLFLKRQKFKGLDVKINHIISKIRNIIIK
ncbi:MAG: hypothetical protein JW891_03190 [Candidatus Lokiarchaeota archaeon]|nr:hypothetical protein [Candidatus Lokiarchaeota archaeon]